MSRIYNVSSQLLPSHRVCRRSPLRLRVRPRSPARGPADAYRYRRRRRRGRRWDRFDPTLVLLCFTAGAAVIFVRARATKSALGSDRDIERAISALRIERKSIVESLALGDKVTEDLKKRILRLSGGWLEVSRRLKNADVEAKLGAKWKPICQYVRDCLELSGRMMDIVAETEERSACETRIEGVTLTEEREKDDARNGSSSSSTRPESETMDVDDRQRA